MWIYGLLNVAAWVFVFFKMPDLTGHSLEDIETSFASAALLPPTSTVQSGAKPPIHSSARAWPQARPVVAGAGGRGWWW